MLPIETIAIVEATAPDVQANAAAITFRMWHVLPPAAQRLLFAEFALEGRALSLLDAIIATARQRRSWAEALPRLMTPIGADASPTLYAEMEPVLTMALAEVLGTFATGAVLNAWRQAFRCLTQQAPR